MAKTPQEGQALGDDAAFVWNDGVRVAGTQIWCDAERGPGSGAFCFVSSAHHRVAWRGSLEVRILAHPRTLALAAATGSPAVDALPSQFGRPFALGRLRLELLPSGHVPGAAQLLVESSRRKVLYAGAVNPVATRTAEPLQLRAADAIALEAKLAPLTVGRPLPPRAEVEAAIVTAVQATLAEGVTPVLLVTALGGAGEVASLLLAHGLELRAHRRIAASLAAYERLGIPLGGPVPRLRGAVPATAAVLWPLDARHPPPVARPRRLVVAGEALDTAFVAAHDGQAGFALADEGDLPSLLQLVLDVGARDVYLSAGLTDEVARAFEAKKLRVHPLGRPAQMPLAGV